MFVTVKWAAVPKAVLSCAERSQIRMSAFFFFFSFCATSFVNSSTVRARICEIYTNLIVSETHAHSTSPEGGQHSSVLPLIIALQNAICQLHCRRPHVSGNGSGGSGVGGGLKSLKVFLTTPPPQTAAQSQWLTCCFISDTNTWEKDMGGGPHSDHRELCVEPVVSSPRTSVSSSHLNRLSQK